MSNSRSLFTDICYGLAIILTCISLINIKEEFKELKIKVNELQIQTNSIERSMQK